MVGLRNAETDLPLSLSRVFAEMKWYIAWPENLACLHLSARTAARQTMFRMYV